MATLRPDDHQPKVERAITALDDFSIIGIVEDFNLSLKTIAQNIQENFPSFTCEIKHANKSKPINLGLGPALDQLLNECNKDDVILWINELDRLKFSENQQIHAKQFT